MRKQILLLSFILMMFHAFSQQLAWERAEYSQLKQEICTGWNTWNSRSVLQQVLLPEGLAINLGFKQHDWIEEDYLPEALIGRSNDNSEHIKPGIHSWDGSYTELEIHWHELHAIVQTAHIENDLVILISPLKPTKNAVKLIIEAGYLWNKTGIVSKEEGYLMAESKNKKTAIYCTEGESQEMYIPAMSPYISIVLDRATGISTGSKRSLEDIKNIIAQAAKDHRQKAKENYKNLAEAYLAVEAGIAWNTVYEPKYDRVVSTVGRLWNEEYGGFCLFGWDNFFLAYVCALDQPQLAIANLIEHMRSLTPEGFIPNDDRGNGSKSFDRSQPPVGSIMAMGIYDNIPEKWILEAVFEPLLSWNRWWPKMRDNEGMLSYGSHKSINPFHEPNTHSSITAGYESGMDDSPMYDGVAFNKEKNTFELQDVGLTSLYIADCKALAKIAGIIGKNDEAKELNKRAAQYSKAMQKLWDEKTGLFLNYRTDIDTFSYRLSPTLFYPLLAGVASDKQAKRMIEEHFYNPEEFYGDWMLPSIARNDPDFPKQRYWKGAIWPPLNFLTYLSLKQYQFDDAAAELSEKSMTLFLNEWLRQGFVSENYSAITGTGDDQRLSSDRFHSWGTLFGIMEFMEQSHLKYPVNQ